MSRKFKFLIKTPLLYRTIVTGRFKGNATAASAHLWDGFGARRANNLLIDLETCCRQTFY